MKPTLLVLAAGMGSRYGSLKQMDGVGPHGEAIIDYSIYDAIQAGFGKVVFVIRESFSEEFSEMFSKDRFGGKIDVEFVFQELDNLPKGFTVPEGREKPWGTNHAVMVAENVINEPFAVINADDFYGRDAFEKVGGYLKTLTNSKDAYCMVGYKVKNTLSDHGSVSRGVCEVDANNFLTSIVERMGVERIDGQVYFVDNGKKHPISDETAVSMNMFGFTPDYFDYSNEQFATFLKENVSNKKAEYFIPLVVNNLVSSKTAKMKVLTTDEQWFGVTYKEDRPIVVQKIRDLIKEGLYPENLWK